MDIRYFLERNYQLHSGACTRDLTDEDMELPHQPVNRLVLGAVRFNHLGEVIEERESPSSLENLPNGYDFSI